MKLPNHTFYFGNKKNGPTVVIMGGLHGDEPLGVAVIETLKSELENQQINGEIYLIIGNPKAVKKGERFIDMDLNRLFGNTLPKDKLSTEEKRCQKLSPILAKADYLLDIHSTGKPSTPFIYSNLDQKHLELAEIFETEFVVGTASKFKIDELHSSADNFVDKNGGIGFTYESGWNENMTVLNHSIKKAKEFLSAINIAFTNIEAKKSTGKLLEIYQAVRPTYLDFELSYDYPNFYIIQKGNEIARENGKKIFAKEDSYVIFPKKTFKIKRTACYLARAVK